MQKKIKILLVQPDFHKYYVSFLPNYEPLVMILLASLVDDIAEPVIFDRRFEKESSLVKMILDFKPDIVATRTHTSGEISNSCIRSVNKPHGIQHLFCPRFT